MADVFAAHKGIVRPPPGAGLDYSVSLSAGLLSPAFFMLEGGGGTVYDSLQGAAGSFANAAWAPSILGGLCPSFNGTNAGITSAGPGFGTSTAGSASFWMLPTFALAAAQHYIYDSTSTNRYLFFKGSTDITEWGWYVDGTTVWDSSGTLAGLGATNVWTHVVLTWISGTELTYKNGVLFATRNVSLAASATPANLYIGMRNSSTLFWQGAIDQVLFWNRVLAPAEVQQLYQQPFCLLAAPRRFWSLRPTTLFPLGYGHSERPLRNAVYRM